MYCLRVYGADCDVRIEATVSARASTTSASESKRASRASLSIGRASVLSGRRRRERVTVNGKR
jgi:hypothetical protein